MGSERKYKVQILGSTASRTSTVAVAVSPNGARPYLTLIPDPSDVRLGADFQSQQPTSAFSAAVIRTLYGCSVKKLEPE